MKPLSEQLAELSAHARNVENAFAGAQQEAHEKIEARKAEAMTAARNAVEQVNRQLKSVGQSAATDWNALQAKIAADMSALMAHMASAKHQFDAKLAEKRADVAELDAGFAIDYAIAAIEQAGLAVLDAIEARRAAERANDA
jgi:hypothetical protein